MLSATILESYVSETRPQNREYIYGMHVITSMETPTSMMKIKVDSINKLRDVQHDIVHQIYERRGKAMHVSYNDIIAYMLDHTDTSRMVNDIYRKKLNK